MIDLTLSDDDDEIASRVPTRSIPIPRSIIPPRLTQDATQNHTPITQEPFLISNHGLLSDGFYSREPWNQSQSSQHPTASNRFINRHSSDENPAKRMRVGERPPNLISLHNSALGSAMPEVPLNILDRAIPRVDMGNFAPQSSVSAHHALNIVNEAAFHRPRKSTKRKDVSLPNVGREHQAGVSRNHGTNTLQSYEKSNLLVKHAQKTQIFPHIKKFLEKYGKGLPAEEIRRVGKEVRRPLY